MYDYNEREWLPTKQLIVLCKWFQLNDKSSKKRSESRN